MYTILWPTVLQSYYSKYYIFITYNILVLGMQPSWAPAIHEECRMQCGPLAAAAG